MLSLIVNLLHFTWIALLVIGIEAYLRRANASRFRRSLRLLQLLPLALGSDILIGLFLIDAAFGSTPSASWMSKSLWIFPCLMLFALWRLFSIKRPVTTPQQNNDQHKSS